MRRGIPVEYEKSTMPSSRSLSLTGSATSITDFSQAEYVADELEKMIGKTTADLNAYADGSKKAVTRAEIRHRPYGDRGILFFVGRTITKPSETPANRPIIFTDTGISAK